MALKCYLKTVNVSDDIAQVKEIVKSCIGEDEFNFEANQGGLPPKVVKFLGGDRQVFSRLGLHSRNGWDHKIISGSSKRCD